MNRKKGLCEHPRTPPAPKPIRAFYFRARFLFGFSVRADAPRYAGANRTRDKDKKNRVQPCKPRTCPQHEAKSPLTEAIKKEREKAEEKSPLNKALFFFINNCKG